MKTPAKILLLFCALFCMAALSSCEIIDSKIDQYLYHRHTYGEYIPDGKANCTESGTKTAKCKGCTVTRTITDKAKGHTPKTIEALAATCDKTGLTAGEVCEVCGVTVKAQRVTAVIPHTYGDDEVCDECNFVNRDFNFEKVSLNNVEGYAVIGVANFAADELTVPAAFGGLPVLEIKAGAFSDCAHIKSLSLSASVAKIADGAFFGLTDLETLEVAGENENYMSAQNCLIDKATNTLILGCKNSLIPETVTKIGADAFAGCRGLKTINIPASVELIESGAFKDCSGIEMISVAEGNTVYKSLGNGIVETATSTLILGCKNTVIADGVSAVGAYAFDGCTELTDIIVPLSVTVDPTAFRGCHKLFSDGALLSKTDDGYVFYDDGESVYLVAYTGGKSSLVLPAGYNGSDYSVYKYFAYNNADIVSVTLSEGVTSLSAKAFAGCVNLKNINIIGALSSIASDAFEGCISLEKIVVSSANTTYAAKGNCLIETETKTLVLGCKSSVIPSDGSVEIIGNGAFAGCIGLFETVIPEKVKTVGAYAFMGCKNLKTVTLSADVETIGEGAFYSCSSLFSIVYNGAREKWEAVTKGIEWDGETGEYTVKAADDLPEAEAPDEGGTQKPDGGVDEAPSGGADENSGEAPTETPEA